MGTWATVQKRWPGFFLPTITQERWEAVLPLKKVLYDFCGMAGVGFFRGLIVYGPTVFIGASLSGVLYAIFANTLAQPVAYLAGRFMPFAIWNNTPKSAEWGEFLIGLGWLASLAAFLWA